MRYLATLLLVFAANIHAEEYVTMGLYTTHLTAETYEDSGTGADTPFNEDNRGLQYTRRVGRTVYTAATFVNSYYKRSAMVGYGFESPQGTGIFMAAVYGYEGYSQEGSTFGKFMVLPIAYQRVGPLRISLIGTAVSVGLEVNLD